MGVKLRYILLAAVSSPVLFLVMGVPTVVISNTL
jgi:hypothetical protein